MKIKATLRDGFAAYTNRQTAQQPILS